MITHLSHACIYVLDQDVAYDFYVNKLGFKVHTDAPMGEGLRWLTVAPPNQTELEITLMPTKSGLSLDDEKSNKLEELIKMGTFGFGVFDVDDCRKTYEDLKAKGVEFKGEPEEQFYGIEAVFSDPFGNWFSMTQRKPH